MATARNTRLTSSCGRRPCDAHRNVGVWPPPTPQVGDPSALLSLATLRRTAPVVKPTGAKHGRPNELEARPGVALPTASVLRAPFVMNPMKKGLRLAGET